MQQEARYCRAQAEMCTKLARENIDDWIVLPLLEMAADFISRAERLDAVDASSSPFKRALSLGSGGGR